MSGRNCAQGFYFQYLVSLQFLLDFLVMGPANGGLSVDPHGDQLQDRDRNVEFIDVEVDRGEQTRVVVAQVKGAVNPLAAAPVGGPELAGWCRRLVTSRPSESYQLVTNRRLTEPAAQMAAALGGGDATAVARVWPYKFAQDLQDPTLGPLILKCRVVREARNTEELLDALRGKIRTLRLKVGNGTGDAAAGLMTIYLVGKLLHYGSGDHPARITATQAWEWLRVTPAELAQGVGRYDWGVPIGVPFARARIRTKELAELARRFILPCRTDSRQCRIVTITGLSGRGKSTLSAQFACDYADHYEFIWWVDCSSDYSINHSFKRLVRNAPALDWACDEPSLDDLAVTLSRFPGRWLMVADNVADMGSLTPWLPAMGLGDVIITTVNSNAWGTEPPIRLHGFTPEESREFLADLLPALRTEPMRLDQLAEALEHWPLALAMAAAYVTNAQRDVRSVSEAYLLELRLAAAQSQQAVPTGYPRTLAAAISLVVDQVARRAIEHPPIGGVTIGPYVTDALTAAAYCAESDIPLELLGLGGSGRQPDGPSRNTMLTDSVVALLRSGSLVERTVIIRPADDEAALSDTIAVNRITQDVIRCEFEATHSTDSVGGFLNTLVTDFQLHFRPSVDHQRFSDAILLAKHAERLVQHAFRLGLASMQTAALFGNLALSASQQGRWDVAIELLEYEVEMIELICGSTPTMMTVQAHVQLGQACTEVGRPIEQILDRIEDAVIAAEQVRPTAQGQHTLNLQWFNLDSMVSGLTRHESHPRVCELRERISANRSRATLTGSGQSTTVERWMSELSALEALMRREGGEAEVLQRAQYGFDQCPHQQMQISFLGLQLEALAYLGDTSGVMNGIHTLDMFAQPPELFVSKVVDALQNVGYAIRNRLDEGIEYQLVLTHLLRVSAERMQRAPCSVELEWLHHILSAHFHSHCGNEATANHHIAAAKRQAPAAHSMRSLKDWEDLLARCEERSSRKL